MFSLGVAAEPKRLRAGASAYESTGAMPLSRIATVRHLLFSVESVGRLRTLTFSLICRATLIFKTAVAIQVLPLYVERGVWQALCLSLLGLNVPG